MRKRSIFFAYSWDKITKFLYDDLASHYRKKDWEIRCGADYLTSPKELGKIETFKNLNKQLYETFVKNIQDSDIFIADVTHLNPNVMVELGIAINLSKNILILSGIPAEKIPFDIKGFKIEFYKTLKDLKKKIKNYLNTFLLIKNLSFNNKRKKNFLGKLYFNVNSGMLESPPETIRNGEGPDEFRISPIPLILPRMKDVKLRVKYKIVDKHNDADWFGFMFRAAESRGGYEPVTHGSILVNARYNGNTDITLYPGQITPKAAKTHNPHDSVNFRRLEIILDNDYLKVIGDIGEFEYKPIGLVSYGHLYLASYHCKTEFKDLEIINIDTTTEISSS